MMLQCHSFQLHNLDLDFRFVVLSAQVTNHFLIAVEINGAEICRKPNLTILGNKTVENHTPEHENEF